MYERILFPTDGSRLARMAIPRVAYIARTTGAPVTVLGVAPSPPAEAVSHILLPLALPEAQGATERRVYETTADLQTEGVMAVESVVVEGDPESQIIETAREVGADLIVMGKHGRSEVESMLLGSVSEGVVQHAECAVLLIPEEDDG